LLIFDCEIRFTNDEIRRMLDWLEKRRATY
jgi:hypothetical protein